LPAIEAPAFYAIARAVRVRCESHKTLANSEIACEVMRVSGPSEVVITDSRYFFPDGPWVQGWEVGDLTEGRLVDFPSGHRLAVPADKVERL
jgi:hypothetical protein